MKEEGEEGGKNKRKEDKRVRGRKIGGEGEEKIGKAKRTRRRRRKKMGMIKGYKRNVK